YGFAKRAKNAQQQWSSLIQKYFDLMRPHFIFILLDIRIPPTEDDFTMIRWAQSFNIPIIVILTKADKIAPSKLKSIEMELIEMIQNETNLSSFSHLCYSIKQPKARQQLIALINQFE
ncbi:MAG: hypothetical protein K9M13_01575, partial [Simkaniaceae bacterium]|nr:hypothetical protein [Simkaniaceae bacterium]